MGTLYSPFFTSSGLPVRQSGLGIHNLLRRSFPRLSVANALRARRNRELSRALDSIGSVNPEHTSFLAIRAVHLREHERQRERGLDAAERRRDASFEPLAHTDIHGCLGC